MKNSSALSQSQQTRLDLVSFYHNSSSPRTSSWNHCQTHVPTRTKSWIYFGAPLDELCENEVAEAVNRMGVLPGTTQMQRLKRQRRNASGVKWPVGGIPRSKMGTIWTLDSIRIFLACWGEQVSLAFSLCSNSELKFVYGPPSPVECVCQCHPNRISKMSYFTHFIVYFYQNTFRNPKEQMGNGTNPSGAVPLLLNKYFECPIRESGMGEAASASAINQNTLLFTGHTAEVRATRRSLRMK